MYMSAPPPEPGGSVVRWLKAQADVTRCEECTRAASVQRNTTELRLQPSEAELCAGGWQTLTLLTVQKRKRVAIMPGHEPTSEAIRKYGTLEQPLLMAVAAHKAIAVYIRELASCNC